MIIIKPDLGPTARNAYALRRITGFLDPWANRLGEGYQLVQSLVAFGRGGLFGVGIGNGQQKLAYLPEAHTDFILALVAEELGLIGVHNEDDDVDDEEDEEKDDDDDDKCEDEDDSIDNEMGAPVGGSGGGGDESDVDKQEEED